MHLSIANLERSNVAIPAWYALYHDQQHAMDLCANYGRGEENGMIGPRMSADALRAREIDLGGSSRLGA